MSAAKAGVRQVAKTKKMQLGIVRGGPGGIGALVSLERSAGLIRGVRIQPLVVHPDDRGFFEELFQMGTGLAEGFASEEQVQVSAALSYAGTVKAIHYHLRQTDLWHSVTGSFQVMLYDLRQGSPTFGQTNTIFAGIHRPLQILIPPGVGHGYKVVGPDPALLVYATDRFYDPADEGRLEWNDPDIRYDWETQRK